MASSSTVLSKVEIGVLHRELLAAQARNDDEAAVALTKQLRSGLSFTRKVQLERGRAQTLGSSSTKSSGGASRRDTGGALPGR